MAEASNGSQLLGAQAVGLGVWPAARQGVTVKCGWTLHLYERMP